MTSKSIYSGDDVSNIYKKLEHKQHVLQLPDTYIGSIDIHEDELYVLADEAEKLLLKKSLYFGLISIFNEIL